MESVSPHLQNDKGIRYFPPDLTEINVSTNIDETPKHQIQLKPV
jgi:hypothetical protein